MDRGGEPFRWDALVPLFVHPLKVTIIEALLWVERPVRDALEHFYFFAEHNGSSPGRRP